MCLFNSFFLLLTANALAVEHGHGWVDGDGVPRGGDEPVGATADVGADHLGGGGLLLRPGDVHAVVAHRLHPRGAERAAHGALEFFWI